MNTKYVLTYDLKILYCQDIDLNLACKELNLETLQFRLYDGKREDLYTGFELNPNEVNVIAKKILMGKIGYELSEEKMKWLIKFEDLLKTNISLILNKKVAYSYFILKLQLLGFAEGISQDIIDFYYQNLEQNKPVAHPQIFLKRINELIKHKILWIPNNLEHEETIETNFLKDVIYSKLDTMYKFSFDKQYGDVYLNNICKNGIVHKILEYNMHPSYLVRKKRSALNLIPFLFSEYELTIENLMKTIYTNNYMNINYGFITDTIKHMETYLRLYISTNYK